MISVSIAELRHRVTLQRAGQLQDNKGGYTTNWTPFAVMNAKVEGLDGRESMFEHSLQGVSSYRVTVRWRSGVKDSDQLQLTDGTVLNIRSVCDPDGRRRWLTIMADTGSVVREQ